jgi:two-component system KDP operon response regulator KdpE
MTDAPGADPVAPGERQGPAAESGGGAVVVVIEDEPQIRRFLRPTLGGEGYHLVEAGTGEEGVMQVATRQPDIVILDLGLPDMDGLEVLRRLREWTAVPIIVLSARGQERDKIAALDAGADDYVAKPFAVGELLARMRVALRHATGAAREPADSTFVVGDIRVDLGRRRVFVGGAEVHLTRTEYKLLTTLIRHAGKVLTHRQLLQEVWGPPYAEQTHYLRVYMAQLRHKLETDSTRPRFLLTEPGVGYRLLTD